MQSALQRHSTVVEISQRAFALGVSATVYDQCCKQEQRILREMARIQQQLDDCRKDKKFYGKIIGME
jgi:hypothetical protein